MNKLLDLIAPNIDIYGYITQVDSDGGDTLQREGMFMFGSHLYFKLGLCSFEDYMAVKWRFINRLGGLEHDGLLRRHPDSQKWYGDWNRCSRDQFHSIIGIGACGLRQPLNRILTKHAMHLFLFAWNTRSNATPGNKQPPDITTMDTWAMELRSMALAGCPWANAMGGVLLPILDVGLLANSLVRRYKRWAVPDDTDSINHLQQMALAHTVLPNFVSRLAFRLYGTVQNAQTELADYFHPRTCGVTGLGQMWSVIVEKLWG